MNSAADEIEFDIKRLPRGGFKATVHTFSGGRWSLPDSKLFASELESMKWINSRLAFHGFEEAYRLGDLPIGVREFMSSSNWP